MTIKRGHIFWLFGLSGVGKSTLAGLLADEVRESPGIPVLELDGDTLRAGLSRDLGYSDDARSENLRRAAEAARLGINSGLCVIASFITPLESHRRLVREIAGARNLSLIFVDSPLEVCRQRDRKGLYAKAQAGQISHMTGIGSVFEPPPAPDLTVQTSNCPPLTSVTTLVDFAKGILGEERITAPSIHAGL